MPDDGLLKLALGPSPDKWTTIFLLHSWSGLQTNRSPLATFDISRLMTKWLGGRADALLDGVNCEISNNMTIKRRPGLSAYGVTSIEPPQAIGQWQISTTGDLLTLVDTKTGGANGTGQFIRYSPTNAGVYFNKGVAAKQTNWQAVINTLYVANGSDLLKIVGPNLLTQSNTYSVSPWSKSGATLTSGQTDPLGGSTATQVVWSSGYLTQTVKPNYTPVASNTFTFSVWMKQTSGGSSGLIDTTISISDQSGTIVTDTVPVSSTWNQFQVTGTMGSGSTEIIVTIAASSGTAVLYGAQLEVGGPATTAQITTTKPQGVYLWGIQAPSAAPTFTLGQVAGSSLPNAPDAWTPNTAYTEGQVIVDSNGDIQQATNSGTSGSIQPVWAGPGDDTTDGSTVVQFANDRANASTLAVPFPNAVTATDTLFAFIFVDAPATTPTIAISDSQGNSWSLKSSVTNAGDQHAYVYAVASAAAGATTVTVTVSSPAATGIWMCIVEADDLSGGLDADATNAARDKSGANFTTGGITTTNASDLLFTFGTFSNNSAGGTEVGVPPSGYTSVGSILGWQSRTGSGHYMTGGVSYEYLTATQAINPEWTINTPGGSNALTGVTIAYKTASVPLIWENLGPVTSISGNLVSAGLSLAVGVQYYAAFMNSQTGHVSNVSPISSSTGATGNTAIGQPANGIYVALSGVGMQTVQSGGYGQDPQVDTIAIFRNTDGGSYWYQLATFANPGSASSAGTWTLDDFAPDTGETISTNLVLNGGSPTVISIALNDDIYAPIGLLNTPPPAGMVNMFFFAGRMFGSVNSTLYYAASTDNAALLNIQENGVSAESWPGANYVPFDSPLVRGLTIGNGALIYSNLDAWLVTGTSLLAGGFNATKAFAGHGILSYNAVALDGSTLYVYLADRQMMQMNAASGSVEIGYAIGNVLAQNISPVNAYVVRHISGSIDNAVFLADGATQWYRLNPNQQGASASGEQAPVWSPRANFVPTIGGIGAIASIQTSPGATSLLVGQTTFGPLLVRNLENFTDDDLKYSWSATIGSLILEEPGMLSEVDSITLECNNLHQSAVMPQCFVLLNEIGEQAGTLFEQLGGGVNDPPQLYPSTTILSQRFYLDQGGVCPTCRHMQIRLSGGQTATADEILSISLRAARVSEQI